MTPSRVLVPLSLTASLALFAQDLAPRAYVVTPVGSNAVVESYLYNRGSVLLDPTVPIEDLRGEFQVLILSYYRSFGFFGRSSNATVSLPYGFGHFTGKVTGNEARVSRSGLGDFRARWSVNLFGGRAMKVPEFMKHRERRILGASITVVVPSGQYDPARLINVSANRWALKPELGFSQRRGPWALDAYAGTWFFGDNTSFYPGTTKREQNPIASLEFHVGYYLRPRLWASFDSNFWSGGSTVSNGNEGRDSAKNSRLGGTVSVPFRRQQSLKFSFSKGAIVRVGGNYTTLTAGWQYSWLTKAK